MYIRMWSSLLFAPLIAPSLLCAQADEIASLVESHQLAGLSVVSRCGGAVSTEVHSGWRDIGLGLEVDAATVYRVASISKAVVALAAAKLAEQGSLGLDAPLGAYLEDPPFHPDFPNDALTLRHLLTHTSGIRDGEGYGPFLSDAYDGIPNVPSLSSVLGEGGPHYTPDMWGAGAPGTYFQYANLNFGVAATVLEAATGTRFDLLMESLIFAPYGLDAAFRVQDLNDISNLAVLYRQQEGQWAPQADNYGGVMPEGPDWSGYTPGTNATCFSPQGGLRSSARDLSVMAQLWSTGSAQGPDGQPLALLGPQALTALHQAQWSYNGDNGNNYYGLFNQWASGLHRAASGLGQDAVIPDVAVSPFIGHPGEAYGLISDAYATPDGQWNFAFLTNGKWDGYSTAEGSAFYALEQDVFAALREDLLQCVSQGVAGTTASDAVVGTPRVGDTLVVLRPGVATEAPMAYQIRDAQGRLLQKGRAERDERGWFRLGTPPLGRGVHYGECQAGERLSRFLFYVPG
jgi:CubicO group peptidase (beta-lactamase class C family)